jgi:hypothetical protein
MTRGIDNLPSVYAEIMRGLANCDEVIAGQHERRRELLAKRNDCLAAFRLFDLPLPEGAELPAHNAHAITLREFVLCKLKDAYPNPLTSSAIKNDLDAQGRKTHPKTVGMTLFRLKHNGKCRRDGGRDWYFVPDAITTPDGR